METATRASKWLRLGGHDPQAAASAWPAFTNLRLNLLDETGSERPGDVYAKVAAE